MTSSPGSSLHQQLFDQAVAAHRSGDLAAAERYYRQVLKFVPQQPDATHLLGLLSHQAGDSAAGLALIDQAIARAPRSAAYHDSRAQALLGLGRFDAAIEAARRAVRLGPKSVVFQYNLGRALFAAHRDQEAIACYRSALRLEPNSAILHFNLGVALARDGALEAAEASFAEVVRLEPGNLAGWGQLAQIRARRDDLAGAVLCYRSALRARPDYVPALSKLAETLCELNQFDDAAAVLRDATREHPREPAIWSDLGNVETCRGRLEDAIACLDQALKLDPGHVLAHYNRGVALLGSGQYAEGFAEWEWRWRRPEKLRLMLPGTPVSDDDGTSIEDLRGKRLLIHGEEGLGDTIQFCRFVPIIAEQAHVLLSARPALARLMGTLAGRHQLIASEDSLKVEVDFNLSIHSLPKLLGITLVNLPATPYLHTAPDFTARWRARLAGLPGKRVGLVWAGNEDYVADRRRSLNASLLGPLAGTPGVSFVSLQIGGAARTVLSQAQRAALGLIDHTADMRDFADTAALVAALDLVIAVDTATAHLAGAMGHPVWLLNRFDTDWRWLRERADSPWYPGMRVFRQAAPGEWGGVVREVRAALEEWAR